MSVQSKIRKKTYTPPKINKLTSEQTNLVLIGHAGIGNRGAKDLLDMIYRLNEPDGSPVVPAHFEAELQMGSLAFIDAFDYRFSD